MDEGFEPKRAAPAARVTPGGPLPDAEIPLDPRAILTSIGEVVYDWDIASDRLVWGLNVRDVLGLDRGERIGLGRAFGAFVEPGSGRTRHEAIVDSQGTDGGSGVAYRTRYSLRPNPDRLIAVEDAGRWFAGADGRPACAHGVLRMEPATSLPAPDAVAAPRGLSCDRHALVADIAREIAAVALARRPMTLMIASIDELSRFNDMLGYETSDAIIQSVLARLSGAMRRRDRLARYAGNRFAALLLSCCAGQAETAARRFIRAVEASPVATATGNVGVRLRLGAAIMPDHGSDAAPVLRHAEEALAHAKRHGIDFVAYSPALRREADRRTQEGGLDLVGALNDRRLRIARQPVVETRSRRVAFEEVLVRIERPDGSLAGAGEIVPAAERHGLVRLVDHRVLELAVDCLAREPEARLAINVSPFTLMDPDWLTGFAAHLGARPGVADRLIVEITETAAINRAEVVGARLAAMKALGVAVAIDDFGSGHTSFRHLRNFPIDIVKIDGAFVQNLSRSTDDRFFVRTLVDLAQHLGIATVAEWVESEEIACLLASWGVDYLQGDAIGGPPVLDGAQPPLLARAG